MVSLFGRGRFSIPACTHGERQQQLFQDGRALPPGSAGRARRLAGDGTGLAWPLRGDVVEASTVAVEHRLLASKLLPALHRNIDISRRDFFRRSRCGASRCGARCPRRQEPSGSITHLGWQQAPAPARIRSTTGMSMEARDFAREDTGGCRCPSERKNLPKRTALLSFPMPKGQAAYRATPTILWPSGSRR